MTVGLLLLLGIIMIRIRQQNRQVWLGAAFCGAVIAYLLVDLPAVGSPLQLFLAAGAFSIPVIFWLLAHALFDDHFKIRRQHFVTLAGVLVINYTLFFLKTTPATPGSLVSVLGGFLSQAISLLFILWAAFIAYAGKKSDLIEERLHFRKQFVLITTGMIGLTLLAEVVLYKSDSPGFLKFLQMSGIAALTYYFAMRNLTFDSGFFLSQPKASLRLDPPPQELLRKLNRLLQDERVYRDEGLTITRLSERLGEKEYKVRRLINQHLGFRNFNDFLNQYRIQDACEIFLDPDQADITVLEIAYQIGYQYQKF
jgi:AraC-like DNA-binding protein